jgi:hypothetical protein
MNHRRLIPQARRVKQIVLWMDDIDSPRVFRHGRVCPGHDEL